MKGTRKGVIYIRNTSRHTYYYENRSFISKRSDSSIRYELGVKRTKYTYMFFIVTGDNYLVE